MNPSTEQETIKLLAQLKQELKILNLWQSSLPNLEQLASTAPFHYDTLAFEQWLQFIFVARISVMIEKKQPLPSEISMLPMAEESFKNLGNKANLLLKVIDQLDCLLSGKKFNG